MMSRKEEECAAFFPEIARDPGMPKSNVSFPRHYAADLRGFLFSSAKINANNDPIQSIFYGLLSRTQAREGSWMPSQLGGTHILVQSNQPSTHCHTRGPLGKCDPRWRLSRFKLLIWHLCQNHMASLMYFCIRAHFLSCLSNSHNASGCNQEAD